MENSYICLKKLNLSYDYKLFYSEKIEHCLLFKMIWIMCAIEWFSLYGYLRNDKKQPKIAEKSDIGQKVVCKVVFVWYFCSEKDRAFFSL